MRAMPWLRSGALDLRLLRLRAAMSRQRLPKRRLLRELQRHRKGEGMIWLLAFIATIFAANWAVATIGLIPVGFGLMAPAAVLFVGLAFGLRDLVQDTYGRRGVIGAIVIGAALSAFVSPAFALASGVAFLVSEFADLAVYTPLRKRNWYGAVLASNVVGLVIDSAIFLQLAFGSLAFLAGQIVGKAEVTLAFLAISWVVRNRGLLPRHASA